MESFQDTTLKYKFPLISNMPTADQQKVDK